MNEWNVIAYLNGCPCTVSLAASQDFVGGSQLVVDVLMMKHKHSQLFIWTLNNDIMLILSQDNGSFYWSLWLEGGVEASLTTPRQKKNIVASFMGGSLIFQVQEDPYCHSLKLLLWNCVLYVANYPIEAKVQLFEIEMILWWQKCQYVRKPTDPIYSGIIGWKLRTMFYTTHVYYCLYVCTCTCMYQQYLNIY